MKNIFVILVLLIGYTCYPQTKDQRAATLLDEVSAKTKSYKSIKADFAYTMENKQAGINEEKLGTLLVSGDKYKLNIVGQIVMSDGKTIWTYIRESNEVQINSPDNKDDAFTPSKLLSSYNENYKAKILRDKNHTDPNIETLELIPNKVRNFTKAILSVDKTRKQVKSFAIYDKNGNIFTYKVTKFSTDAPVSPADFTFDPKQFPGVEVIDMR
jgi:outer membrane lipoprotein-sorting protein